MSQIERDKFLTEAMGECWHEWDVEFINGVYIIDNPYCTKCHRADGRRVGFDTYPDYSTWKGFGKLFTWCKEQPWWCDIGNPVGNQEEDGNIYMSSLDINPTVFADAIYNFLTKRGDNRS